MQYKDALENQGSASMTSRLLSTNMYVLYSLLRLQFYIVLKVVPEVNLGGHILHGF